MGVSDVRTPRSERLRAELPSEAARQHQPTPNPATEHAFSVRREAIQVDTRVAKRPDARIIFRSERKMGVWGRNHAVSAPK